MQCDTAPEYNVVSYLKAMADSTGEEEEGKERGERVQSTAKPNLTSEEQKQADKQTMPPLSSHHGDTTPPPEREQPLGSEHAPTPVSVGEEYHGNLTEVAHYIGEAIPVQETVVVHSAATQELVTGGFGRCVPPGATVIRPCHFNLLT